MKIGDLTRVLLGDALRPCPVEPPDEQGAKPIGVVEEGGRGDSQTWRILVHGSGCSNTAAAYAPT
jgi:hypothetical protein